MDNLFLTILAFDLRGMKDELTRLATSGPQEPDGPNCHQSTLGATIVPTDHRYHLAREILALWSEEDVATRARMWTAFVINHPSNFASHEDEEPSAEALRSRAATELLHLPAEERSAVVATMLAQVPPSAWFPEETRDWIANLPR